jgi:inhibitor of cysteine peptidase
MRRFLALAAVVALCAAGCGDDVSVSEDDDGGTVDIRRGETLKVSLESNPTTGYEWTIVDDGGLTLVDRSHKVDDPDADGSGGITTFEFQADVVGESTLSMIYHQPWTEDPPNRTYTLKVVVAAADE